MRNLRILATLALASTFAFTACAGAQALIGFDVDEITGVAQANFNLLTKPTSTSPGVVNNALNENGVPTGVSMTLSGTGLDLVGTAAAGSVPMYDYSLADLGGYSFTSALQTIDITGLAPSTEYEFWMIGFRPSAYNNRVNYSNGDILNAGTFFVAAPTGGQLTFNSHLGSSAEDFKDYGLVTMSSSLGTLQVTVQGRNAGDTANGTGAIGGFAIRGVIPEPGSLALAGLGALTLIRRRTH
jgi:hypothetical protein